MSDYWRRRTLERQAALETDRENARVRRLAALETDLLGLMEDNAREAWPYLTADQLEDLTRALRVVRDLRRTW